MSTQSFVTYVTLYILRLQKAGRTTLLAIGLWFIHSIFIDAEGRACAVTDQDVICVMSA